MARKVLKKSSESHLDRKNLGTKNDLPELNATEKTLIKFGEVLDQLAPNGQNIEAEVMMLFKKTKKDK